MDKYSSIIRDAYSGYYYYLKNELLIYSWHNYFYWLIGLSLTVWILEIIFPWRKDQAVVRKDFFLDGFYMFFNFFIFSLIGFSAISNIGVQLFNDFIGIFGYKNIVAIEVAHWPRFAQYILMFFTVDFIHWNIHRMLHKNKYLWEFHKVHHSVIEMGFAAHLRFHWMESVVYKSIQYIPLAMIGFGIQDFFAMHIIAVAIGHLNHSNIKVSYGPFKYLLNNPVMHLWHHAKNLPADRYGVNFGLSLSIWDYLFKTDYLPSENPYEELGFENIEDFPKDFYNQEIYPFKK
ncbi:MAG: sterol desaturase family protein [Saprospiraceae bacterium]